MIIVCRNKCLVSVVKVPRIWISVCHLRCRLNIAGNGSADLRSPEKEVYFRSWDLANSQMCEVRVATSNICGCNPPNRCGERSGADFATSEKVLAKCGLNLNECSSSDQTEPMLFQIVKIKEKNNMKSSGGKKCQIFKLAIPPAFCQYNVGCSLYLQCNFHNVI